MTEPKNPLPPGEARPSPIPPGDVRAGNGYYSVVFYYAPTPAADTLATARTLAQKLLPQVPIVNDQGDAPQLPFIGFEEEEAPFKYFPLPGRPYFKHAARELTEEDIDALLETKQAVRMVLLAANADVYELGRKFTEFALEFAVTTQAYLWDSATRECFSQGAWKTKHLDQWPETGIPDISRQITVHLYRIDDQSSYMRAITLGMEKFALPDVVIERMTGSDKRPADNLITLVCQSLAEQPVIKDGGKEVFSLEQLQSAGMRAKIKEHLEENATMEISLALFQGEHQQGDPNNRLIEIGFQNGIGGTEDERRADLLSKLWGSRDSATGAKHTDELLEASKRAQARIPELRTAFRQGLPPGWRLMVKSPFVRDDDGTNEWMWVEVMKWLSDDALEGILQNDPFHISSLKAGSKVSVNAAVIFDYILHHGDGTSEGNETGRLIAGQGGPEKTK